MIHHTLGPGMDFDTYIKMSEPIRSTHTKLTDPATMAQEIDRVIEEGVRSRLPVYIYVPMDVVGTQLDASRLQIPLNTTSASTDLQLEDEVVSAVLRLI